MLQQVHLCVARKNCRMRKATFHTPSPSSYLQGLPQVDIEVRRIVDGKLGVGGLGGRPSDDVRRTQLVLLSGDEQHGRLHLFCSGGVTHQTASTTFNDIINYTYFYITASTFFICL